MSTALKIDPASTNLVECMNRCPFFREFPKILLAELANHAELVRHPVGYEVLVEGKQNQYLYFLMSGSVAVYSAGDLVIRMHTEGDVIGEVSVLGQKPCNASVIASTEIELLRIDAAGLLDETSQSAQRFQHRLYQIYADILTEKLAITNDRAKKFEKTNSRLEEAQKALISANSELEKKVSERTTDLVKQTEKLEQQNAELIASSHKLAELYNTKDLTFDKLSSIYNDSLMPLRQVLSTFKTLKPKEQAASLQQVQGKLDDLAAHLKPFASLRMSEMAMRDKRVLLAESDRKEQRLARLALGGSGVQLDIVSDYEAGVAALESGQYDVMCTNRSLIELTKVAQEKQPDMKLVFLTSEDIQSFLASLREYPFLANIVARNPDDRGFTVKSLLTTVRKIIDTEMFGLEKYLFWGVEVEERTVEGSSQRRTLIDEMAEHFADLGVRRTIIDDVKIVAEELLMNAIYDAPVDKKGAPMFNHLPRTKPVELATDQQGKFRYACDGVLLALSVTDPFGSFERSTLLDYLENCYSGGEKILDARKGGAGRGLHLLTETSDLVVFNVHSGMRTEAIAIFHVDQRASKNHKHPSFQFFKR